MYTNILFVCFALPILCVQAWMNQGRPPPPGSPVFCSESDRKYITVSHQLVEDHFATSLGWDGCSRRVLFDHSRCTRQVVRGYKFRFSGIAVEKKCPEYQEPSYDIYKFSIWFQPGDLKEGRKPQFVDFPEKTDSLPPWGAHHGVYDRV